MEHLWDRTFTAHPRSVGESYRGHCVAASGIGLRLIAAGLACLVHALVPGWCTRTGSRTIAALARELEDRRRAARYAVAAATADSSRASASLHSRSRS